MGELVKQRLQDGVGVISLNRPEKHNALDNETGAALGEALRWAMGSAEVRCVLLRGEGPSFCSGRDTTQLGQRDPGDNDFAFVRRAQDNRLQQLDSAKPFVAAVRGACIGGGFEMALACDLRFAAPDASFFLPEIRFGILPDTGGTQLLTSLIGPSRTKYLVMTGERIDARTALEWGVVDFVVEPEDLDARALDVARKIAAGPPLAIAMAKQLVDQAWAEPVRRGIRQELLAQTVLFGSEDYQEARAARREGREPRYTGR
jgi:enoyl-CoA hydratase